MHVFLYFCICLKCSFNHLCIGFNSPRAISLFIQTISIFGTLLIFLHLSFHIEFIRQVTAFMYILPLVMHYIIAYRLVLQSPVSEP